MIQKMHDELLMRAALQEAASALEAGEFPVGCVIAADGVVIASGGRRWSRGVLANEIDHAEILALKDLCEHAAGSNPDALSVYTTLEPCLMCFGAILISGIRRIVYAYEDVMGGGTACRLDALPPLYRKRPISVVPHVLRQESLALMQAFFGNPENTYLADTLLAKYTMEQP